jgi:hypothetical protein
VHDHLKARIAHSLSQEEKNEVTFLGIVTEDSTKSAIKKAEDSLKSTAKMYHIPEARIEISQHSDVAKAISDRANQHDFLILGMRKGAWLKSFFFDMIAQQITGQVHCPTLLTKTKSPTRAGLKKSATESEDESCLVE